MRVGLAEDFRWRAGLDQFGQDLAAKVTRVLDLAVKLAVGKGPGPALAELYIGFRVEHAFAPQTPGVLRPLAHNLAPVQDDWRQSLLRQDQTGKEAAGTGAYDHRARPPVARSGDHKAIIGVRGRAHLRVVRQPGPVSGFVSQADVHRIDHQDGAASPRVMRPARHGAAENLTLGQAKALGHCGGKSLRRMAERQFQIGQAQHGGRSIPPRAAL